MTPNTLMAIATGVMAIFTVLIFYLNYWQQKQFKNPIPQIYFSEPQIVAISKTEDKKILINFLVYFLNSGTSPIIGSGIEHRISNIETGEKYKFGKTRFFGDQDKPFGVTIPELHKLLPRIKKIQDFYGFEQMFKIFYGEIMEKYGIEIFSPYPSQKVEDLWSLKGQHLSEEYIMDYPWVIAPHKFKLIRWYIKVPYEDKKYYSFKIKLILHYYCGGKPSETLKSKEFEIKPVLIGDALCFYETIHKEKLFKRYSRKY